MLWDLVGRNPGTVVREAARAFRDAGSLVRGIARVLTGLLFALIALVLVATVTAAANDFSVIAVAVFLAGLGVETLIGDEVRAGIGLRH